MKVITNENLVECNTYDPNVRLTYAVKSPASLSPAEKIQMCEEMGINVNRFIITDVTPLYDSGSFIGNNIHKVSLRQYIEEMKCNSL